MKVLIIALGLAAVFAQSCDDRSCLDCDKGTCNICNVMLNYLPNKDSGCQFHYVQNCEVKDELGGCHRCKPGFVAYYGTCRAVGTASTHADCEHWGCHDNCLRCKPGLIPNGKSCDPFPDGQTKINNCRYYNDKLECIGCEDNFFLGNNQCHASPSNCLVPSGCSACPANMFFKAWDTASFKVNFWENWTNKEIFNDYAVDENSCVENPDLNCETPSSEKVCKQCDDEYEPVNGICTKVNSVNNCLRYTSEKVCEYCKKNFLLINNKCEAYNPVDENCVYFSDAFSCLRCKTEFKIDATSGVCVRLDKTIVDCEAHKSTGDCEYCKTGYYIVGTECKKIYGSIKDCALYNEGCLYCGPKKFVKDGVCVDSGKEVTNCLYYSADNQCAQCDKDFALINNQCLARVITNCAVYDEPGHCLFCIADNYLDAAGACQVITDAAEKVSDCAYYVAPKQCGRCNNRFNLVNGSCYAAPIDNCDAYESHFRCKFCISGYIYNKALNLCELGDKIDGCYRQTFNDQGKQECVICKAGYYISAGACKAPVGDEKFADIANCRHFQDLETCKICSEGYYPDSVTNGDKTVKYCAQAQHLTNCREYQNNACVECLTRFYYDDKEDSCFRVANRLPGCRFYEEGVCAACEDDKSLSIVDGALSCAVATATDANCDVFVDNKCKYCDAGFVDVNGVCKEVKDQTACLAYDKDLNCIVCDKTHYVLDGKCEALSGTPIDHCERYAKVDGVEKCAACELPYYVNAAGQCAHVASQEHCKYWKDGFACAVCEKGYYPKDGGCEAIQEIANCIEYDANGDCAVCDTLFYAHKVQDTDTKKSCVEIDKGILNCEILSSRTACKKCDFGYHLDAQNLCVKNDTDVADCDVQADATTCAECNDDFILSVDKLHCIAFCDKPSDSTMDQCEICSEGYYLVAGKCTEIGDKALTNCKYYDANGVCTECKSGYKLKDAVCEQQPHHTCGTINYDAATCAFCSGGFVADDSGKCVAIEHPIEGCQLYDQFDPKICALCEFTHHLDDTRAACIPNGYYLEQAVKAIEQVWEYKIMAA